MSRSSASTTKPRRYPRTFSYWDDRIFQQLRGMPDEELQSFAHALGKIAQHSGFSPSRIEKMLARGKSLADVFRAVAVRIQRRRVKKTDNGAAEVLAIARVD